jgi:hypothetical protein
MDWKNEQLKASIKKIIDSSVQSGTGLNIKILRRLRTLFPTIMQELKSEGAFKKKHIERVAAD